MKKTLLTSLLLAVAVSPAFASTVVYEPFAQTSGAGLNGTTGGTGLSSWTANSALNVASGSLSFGTLATSGNQVLDTAPGGGDVGTTSTGSSLSGVLSNGSTMWFSFLLNGGSGSNDKQEFTIGTDSITSMFSGNLSSTNGGNGYGVRIEKGSIYASSFSGGTITKGTGSGKLSNSVTALIVGELISGATSADPDTLNLYTPATDLSMGSAVSTVSATLDQTGFNTLAFGFRGASGSASSAIDEIRFGSSYNDVIGVVPEPSAALLGALGCLMLFRRRRC